MIQPAVLAGGSSRRFRSDKRFALVGGEPMVARVFHAAEGVGAPVVLVADQADETRLREVLPRHAQFLHDASPGQGPLVALCGFLEMLDAGDAALLVAADLPNLNAAVVAGLVERAEAQSRGITVPRADGRLQVGCAVYPAAALTAIQRAAASGERSLQRWVMACAASVGDSAPPVAVVEEPEWRTWGGGESPFFNLNTPADRERLARAAVKGAAVDRD